MDVLPGSAHSDSKLDRSHSNIHLLPFVSYYLLSFLFTDPGEFCELCVLLISCWRLITFFSISYYDTFIVINILTIISFRLYQFYSVSCVFYWYLAGDWPLSSVSVTIPLTILPFSYYYSHSNYTYCHFLSTYQVLYSVSCVFFWYLAGHWSLSSVSVTNPPKYSIASDSLNRTPDNYTFINNLDAS